MTAEPDPYSWLIAFSGEQRTDAFLAELGRVHERIGVGVVALARCATTLDAHPEVEDALCALINARDGVTSIRVAMETDEPLPPKPIDEDLVAQARKLVTHSGLASAKILQRKLNVNEEDAEHVMEVLHARGVVGPPVSGNRSRQVLTGPSPDDDGGLGE